MSDRVIERLNSDSQSAPDGPAATAGLDAAPTGLRTRSEAVWLGIRYFTVAAATSCAVGFLVGVLTHASDFSSKCFSVGWWTHIGVSLTVSMPLVVLTGAVSGHEHYRRAAGQERLRAGIVLFLVLALPFAILQIELFPVVCLGIGVFWMIHCANRSVFSAGQPSDLHWPMIGLGVALVIGCCIVCGFLKLKKMDGSLAGCAYCSLFLGDTLVMLKIREWRRVGLVERRSHTFQFSLATMLVFYVALGAYALTLATLFV